MHKRILWTIWTLLVVLTIVLTVVIVVREANSFNTSLKSATLTTTINPAMLKYSAALGDWKGTWMNQTYGTNGIINMNLTLNGTVLQTTINIEGPVFGAQDAETMKSNADLMDSTLNPHLPDSTALGEVVDQQFNADTGQITLVTKPNAPEVQQFELHANLNVKEEPKIEGNYTVKLKKEPQEAKGEISLKKK